MEQLLASHSLVHVIGYLSKPLSKLLRISKRCKLAIFSNTEFWVSCFHCSTNSVLLSEAKSLADFFYHSDSVSIADYWRDEFSRLRTASTITRQWRTILAYQVMISDNISKLNGDKLKVISTRKIEGLLKRFCEFERFKILAASEPSSHRRDCRVSRSVSILVGEWGCFDPRVLMCPCGRLGGPQKEAIALLNDLKSMVSDHPTSVDVHVFSADDVLWFHTTLQSQDFKTSSNLDQWAFGSPREIIVAVKFSSVPRYAQSVARVAAIVRLNSAMDVQSMRKACCKRVVKT